MPDAPIEGGQTPTGGLRPVPTPDAPITGERTPTGERRPVPAPTPRRYTATEFLSLFPGDRGLPPPFDRPGSAAESSGRALADAKAENAELREQVGRLTAALSETRRRLTVLVAAEGLTGVSVRAPDRPHPNDVVGLYGGAVTAVHLWDALGVDTLPNVTVADDAMELALPREVVAVDGEPRHLEPCAACVTTWRYGIPARTLRRRHGIRRRRPRGSLPQFAPPAFVSGYVLACDRVATPIQPVPQRINII
jgi:hypothetical protein